MDSLRAIMMLLGLVIHSAVTYNVTYHGESWPLKDPHATTLATDFLVLLIHTFRMPIFFLVSGFFGSMLYNERGLRLMAANRWSRIVLPFIVFLVLLNPVIQWTFMFTTSVFQGEMDVWDRTHQVLFNRDTYTPTTTSHLWFLYYLAMITLFTTMCAMILGKLSRFSGKVLSCFEATISRTMLRLMVLPLITFVVLKLLHTAMVMVSVSLLPDLATFCYFLLFYVVGWMLYRYKEKLDSFMRYDWHLVVLAVVLSGLQGVLIEYGGMDLKPDDDSSLLAGFNALTVWLFIYGIIGLFVRYGSDYSTRMRYISDASYWVYLIHLPITAFLPGLIFRLALPGMVKFAIVLVISTAISFLTYHYFVRSTFVGKFLNGRKY